MVHITAAIGLALAFLLEIIFWSVAPAAAALVVGTLVLGAVIWALVLGVRRARIRGHDRLD
ncbi:hypothetical protein [Sphingomonas profundi]|uniref:hypothetical protein n=1 Tax=Alterirhizorhabdus profundi TaxID=2681549 RepID=UPI0012E92D5F|nr:hypothetical protein [Sphingomonas profundi]